MNDDLGRRLADSVPPPPPPTGQADAARRYALRRRRRRRGLAASGSALVVVAVLVPLAALRGSDSPDQATAFGQDVTCPGAAQVSTVRQERPRVPAYSSARAAAEAWAGPETAGHLAIDGNRVLLRRGDGSIRAAGRLESSRVDLDEDEPAAWSVDGSVTCDDETSDREWDGGSLLDCRGPLKTVRARVDPADDDSASFPTEPTGLRVERDDLVGTTLLTPGAGSGDVTTVTMRDGVGTIAVRELRIGDVWRIERIAACLPGPPNIDGNAGFHPAEWPVVRIPVGHCSVQPLEDGGRTWAIRAGDDFGSGGGFPPHWFGYGITVQVGSALHYRDLGGSSLTFVPEGSPGAAPTAGACR